MTGSSQRLAPVALCILLFVIYWGGLRAPFLFDDTGAVLNNPTIRDLWSPAVLFPPTDGSTTTGRPIVNLSFALNYAVSGERVWSYHATNVAIHALAALTLMGLVRRTPVPATRSRPALGASERENAKAFGSQGAWSAFFVALLWAVHPLQTESVVCVAQRTESLCGLFYLFTLYAFVRGAVGQQEQSRSPRRWLCVSVAACLAGMGTKEVMVTAPVLVLLYDRTFVAKSFGRALRQRPLYYTALASTWLPLAVLVRLGEGARGSSAGFGLGVTWWTYLLKQAEALVVYLKLSLWPHPLVLDYGTATPASLVEVWWQLAVVVALLAFTIWALVRRPILGFVGAAFFLILAPSSSVVPLVTQTMAEHRMYLPLALLISAATALGFIRLGQRAVWTFAGAGLVLATVTIARVHDYRTVASIWSDTVQKMPGNARAHNNLAWALQQERNSAGANGHFAQAVALQPDYVSARYNWGVALLEQGRPADAVEQLSAAVRLAPEHTDAHVNLGNALTQLGRPVEAVAHFQTALRVKPAADAHHNLGVALSDLRRFDEAETHFKAALRFDPRLHDSHYQLGRLAERAGRAAAAESHYGEVIRLSPDHAPAHAKLGLLLARSERLGPAAEHLRAAIRLRPNDPDAHANLGNVLLHQARPREAIASYEAALRLRPDDARTRENIQIARESLR
jgi:protein O-mannosyl-transferase